MLIWVEHEKSFISLEVIKLEYSLRLKIKRYDCSGHVSTSSQSLRFILSMRMNSSFITSRPGLLIRVLVHDKKNFFFLSTKKNTFQRTISFF